MTKHDMDRALEAVARRQHGVFSRPQVLAAGGTEHAIRTRVRSGAWYRLEPAVYAMAGHPSTWQRQYMAAHLGAPGSAIARLAAAKAQKLTGFRVVRPALVVPPGSNSRSRLAVVHRQAGVLVERVDGIPVTTVAQTFADIAACAPVDRLERAMDDAILERRLSVSDLEERAAFYERSRRRGMPLFRGLVHERAADGWVPPESDLERVLDDVLGRLPSRPRIIRQPGLPWRPAERQRCDRLPPDWRIIVEADGRRWHTRVADFDRDRWRDNEAQAHGYRLLRFTWVHLTVMPADVAQLIEATASWSVAA